MDLASLIRDVPDFPKKGIVFKDIMPLLQDKDGLRTVIDRITERYAEAAIDLVVGVEARGFILAPAIAYRLGTGFAAVRKPGKLPYDTKGVSYELEYGTDRVEMHTDAIREGMRVLLVDDLLATGGTIGAVAKLVENFGGVVASCAFLIELDFLKGRDKLEQYDIFSLIHIED